MKIQARLKFSSEFKNSSENLKFSSVSSEIFFFFLQEPGPLGAGGGGGGGVAGRMSAGGGETVSIFGAEIPTKYHLSPNYYIRTHFLESSFWGP